MLNCHISEPMSKLKFFGLMFLSAKYMSVVILKDSVVWCVVESLLSSAVNSCLVGRENS